MRFYGCISFSCLYLFYLISYHGLMCCSPYIATNNDGQKVPVPCGHCIECLRQFQSAWTFRIEQEIKNCICPVFVTLTYDDEHVHTYYDFENEQVRTTLCKPDLQKFMKRFRKNAGLLAAGCRYFAVGEYGSKFDRSHFHIVLMCPNVRLVSQIRPYILKSWKFGFIKVKYCTHNQIKYVTKYMNKLDDRTHLVKPFRVMSRGIGLRFLSNAMVSYYLTTFSRSCINSAGVKMPLPRYYVRKLDDISLNHPFLKRAGMVFSDVPSIHNFQDDLKAKVFEHQLYFTEHYSDIYALTCQHYAEISRKNGYKFYMPTEQDAWKYYCDSQKFLRDRVLESERLLRLCAINNKLTRRNAQFSSYLRQLEYEIRDD